MAKKAKIADSSAIQLNPLLTAIDKKDHAWWDSLTEEQKKKFSSWLYMRYTSSVSRNPDFARYYLVSTNEKVNKNFSSLKNHPQLIYLLLTSASPGLGTVRHEWIQPSKKSSSSDKSKLLATLFPMANETELEILDLYNTEQDLAEHLRDLGYDDKKIKSMILVDDE